MGTVGSRYSGTMEIVAVGGDAADMQGKGGRQSMAKGGRYDGMTER